MARSKNHLENRASRYCYRASKLSCIIFVNYKKTLVSVVFNSKSFKSDE